MVLFHSFNQVQPRNKATQLKERINQTQTQTQWGFFRIVKKIKIIVLQTKTHKFALNSDFRFRHLRLSEWLPKK